MKVFKTIIILLFLATIFSQNSYSAQITSFNGKCLDVKGGHLVDGAAVIVWSCNGSQSQYWEIAEGLIKSLNGKCFDIKKRSNPADNDSIVIWPCHGEPSQHWKIDEGLIKGLGGKCLDIKGNNPIDGAPIVLWPCHGNQSQHFILK